MKKTRSKSRYSGKSSFPPKKKGLFEDGLWLCKLLLLAYQFIYPPRF